MRGGCVQQPLSTLLRPFSDTGRSTVYAKRLARSLQVFPQLRVVHFGVNVDTWRGILWPNAGTLGLGKVLGKISLCWSHADVTLGLFRSVQTIIPTLAVPLIPVRQILASVSVCFRSRRYMH